MAYLYQHTRNDDGSVFYVGIGIGNRANEKWSRNKHWLNIANKHGYTVEIVKHFDSWEEAAEWEKFFISIYGREDKNEGRLSNMTDGGQGALGRAGELHPFYGKKRPEHSERLKGRPNNKTSERMKGNKHYFYGKEMSAEHCLKISQSKIGKCIGDDNHFYGKNHSDSSKMLISKANSKKIVNANNGEIVFSSLKEACSFLNIKETTLSARLRGRNKNNTGYMYYSDYYKINK